MSLTQDPNQPPHQALTVRHVRSHRVFGLHEHVDVLVHTHLQGEVRLNAPIRTLRSVLAHEGVKVPDLVKVFEPSKTVPEYLQTCITLRE